MAWIVSRQPFTLRIYFQSQVYVRGICVGRSGTKIGFPRTTLVFPFEYHYTIYSLLF
jgi:hypothetical protein